MDVVGGWGHRERGWGVIDMGGDDVADAEGASWTSWVVGGTEDAGEALSTWAVREVADTEGHRGCRGWLGTRMTPTI